MEEPVATLNVISKSEGINTLPGILEIRKSPADIL